MAENWTTITTQDDPNSGFEAVAKGRVFRDNDDCHTRTDQVVQSRNTNVTGFNQTYPNRVATGIKVRFYKPAFAKYISFRYHLQKNTVGGVRTWSVVRFNGNPALETPLQDTNVTGLGGTYPASVTDFDLSSLPAGVYEAEVFAGHGGLAGDPFTISLPGGTTLASPFAPSMGNDFFAQDAFKWSTVDWATSPASDLVDATHLTADKGITQTQTQMLYDRDEKLRRRTAGFWFPEKTSSTQQPAWANIDLGKIYVPRHADILALEIEIKTAASGTANAYLGAVEHAAAGFPFWTDDVHGGVASTSTTYERKTIRTNLSMFRGQEVQLRLYLNNNAAANLSSMRKLENEQGNWWEPGPLPSLEKVAVDWRNWQAAGRSQGALMSAGWWRRCVNRDLDLLERQMLQRAFSYTNSVSGGGKIQLSDSSFRLYQPKGVGASGGSLVGYIELASNGAFTSQMKLDYIDEPDADGFFGITGFVSNGIYRVWRPARADRDGTLQTFTLFRNGGTSGAIYRMPESLQGLFGWRIL